MSPSLKLEKTIAKVKRGAYDGVCEDLRVASVGPENDLLDQVSFLLEKDSGEFLRIMLKPAVAGVTMESVICFEPTDRFLHLVAALGALNADKAAVIDHELHSLVSVGTS